MLLDTSLKHKVPLFRMIEKTGWES